MLRLAFNPGLTLTGIPITRPWQANFRTIMSKNWEHTLYISVKRVGGGGRGGREGSNKDDSAKTPGKMQTSCRESYDNKNRGFTSSHNYSRAY